MNLLQALSSSCAACFRLLLRAGNEFTGTAEVEFYDAQNTHWAGNEVPSTACLDNVTEDDGEDVPVSTFTADSEGLPEEC